MAFGLALYAYDNDIARLIVETLEEEHAQLQNFFPLSALRGEYDAVRLNGRTCQVQAVDEFDFAQAQLAIFTATPDESRRLLPKARQAGCIVIDNSHLFNADHKIPMMLPELNPWVVPKVLESRVVVPPEASAVMLALALSPLHDAFGVSRCDATLLESVSEFGRLGTETLVRETARLMNGAGEDHEGFDAQLAFNLHTRIGTMQENGCSAHESLLADEVTRVLGEVENGLNITCIQVPIFYGHTAVVHVTLEERTGLKELEETLRACGWISLRDNEEMLTPVTHVINERTILISRLRACDKTGKSFRFIAMIDNTRRGEAHCCAGIAKILAKELH